jgi:hypothetical protein
MTRLLRRGKHVAPRLAYPTPPLALLCTVHALDGLAAVPAMRHPHGSRREVALGVAPCRADRYRPVLSWAARRFRCPSDAAPSGPTRGKVPDALSGEPRE